MPFGHPGISAYEYAGVMDRHNHEERAWAKAAEQTSVKRTTTESERRNDASLVVAKILELQQTRTQAQAQSDESVTTQRRRGTFVNHTPRNYEVHLSTNLARRPESSEDTGRLYRAHRGSSDDKTNTDIDHNDHRLSYGSFTTGKRRSFTPVSYGLDIPLNPLIMHPLPAVPSMVTKQRHSRSSSAATSIKSSQTGLSKRSLRNFLSRNTPLDVFPRGHQPASSEESGPTSTTNASKLPPETANSKRRRRQTPYIMPKTFYTGLGRHAPLEPLVLKHRREVTGSDVDALPPHVDVGNENSEAATLLAINEYFDSQESSISGHRSKESDGSLQHPAFGISSAHTKEDTSPISYTAVSEHEEQPTSSRSKRNSKRLSWTNSPFSMASRRRKSASELSMHSDFTSAAKGQYSPYDEHFEAVPKLLKRVSVALSKDSPVQEQGRSVSSASGKLAPRIPRHDELANTSLNDFNSFLRVTGPEPLNEAKTGPKKKKKGLRVIQVRSRKDAKKGTGRPRTGSNASMLLQLPACAQPKTTSFGTKHVEIVPKMKMDVGTAADQTVHRPTANDTNCQKHEQTKAWTEEMLQPLGSSSIEHIIDPVSTVPSTTAPRSPLRSAKPAARSPQSVPVENHPLLPSRHEQTRIRKLRDLKKAKEKVDTDEEKRRIVDEKVARLESLVVDLAEALAYSAGLNVRLTPEEILEAWVRLGRK